MKPGAVLTWPRSGLHRQRPSHGAEGEPQRTAGGRPTTACGSTGYEGEAGSCVDARHLYLPCNAHRPMTRRAQRPGAGRVTQTAGNHRLTIRNESTISKNLPTAAY